MMLLNRIRPKIEDILRKNQNGFRTNRSTTRQILTIRRLIEGVKSKNLPAILLFIDFSKAFRFNRQIKIKIYSISIWDNKRNDQRNNDTIYKHSRNGQITRWRYPFLRYYHRSSARRYLSTIYIYYLFRLHNENID